MNRANREVRNALIRRRRAKGVLLKTIALEFGISIDSVQLICRDVDRPPLRPKERADISSKRKAIVLDAEALAVIEDAKRNPGPPYKNALGWAP